MQSSAIVGRTDTMDYRSCIAARHIKVVGGSAHIWTPTLPESRHSDTVAVIMQVYAMNERDVCTRCDVVCLAGRRRAEEDNFQQTTSLYESY